MELIDQKLLIYIPHLFCRISFSRKAAGDNNSSASREQIPAPVLCVSGWISNFVNVPCAFPNQFTLPHSKIFHFPLNSFPENLCHGLLGLWHDRRFVKPVHQFDHLLRSTAAPIAISNADSVCRRSPYPDMPPSSAGSGLAYSR